MSSVMFSEWRKLPVSVNELCIKTTLRCGQSFRWYNVPHSDEWRCVLRGRILSLRQDPKILYYRTYRPQKPRSMLGLPTPPNSHPPSRAEGGIRSETEFKDDVPDGDDTLELIHHYFNLASNLTDLYSQWSISDPNFKKKALQFTGIRILRQDAWEALVSFICSSNNNIARISQMVEKLCLHYGPFIGSVDGRAYHDFPPPEALTGDEVEGRLRSLGFGYRAKFIHRTAVMVAKEREDGWLDLLRNPENPAFGAKASPGGEMKPEGRDGYREAHEKLLYLQGVGPKVADCVCLMGLGWGEAVPVDTHVWQIAQRDYKMGKGSQKTLSKAMYDAVGNHFRRLWGKEAGWAHSVLFTADLRTFSDRLVTSKKAEANVEVQAKEDVFKVETNVTTAVAVKRPREEDEMAMVPKHEDEDEASLLIHASRTTTTRRMSKRLRGK